MNPLRTAASAITHPVRTAGFLAGASFGVARTGVRTTARVVGWAVERAAGHGAEPVVVDEMPATRVPAPSATKTAPAKKPPAKKTPAKKSARKAPSKKAAVVAPALGLTEEEAEDVLRTPSGIPAAGDGHNPDTTETDLHQPGTEPVMDPATVKAAVSESEMMRRAADRDKG